MVGGIKMFPWEFSLFLKAHSYYKQIANIFTLLISSNFSRISNQFPKTKKKCNSKQNSFGVLTADKKRWVKTYIVIKLMCK